MEAIMRKLIIVFLVILFSGCAFSANVNQMDSATQQQLEIVSKAATSLGVIKFLNKNPKWVEPTKLIANELSKDVLTFEGNLQELKTLANSKINYDVMDNEERELTIALVDLGFMMLVPNQSIELNLVPVTPEIKERAGKFIGWVIEAADRYQEKK